MKTTRRALMGGAAAVLAAPGIVRSQPRPPANRTLRVILHGDIPTYDPIWTTANMAANHGALVYDTLGGIDEKVTPQPQMVGRWGWSDDKLTLTMELRDGLKWTDGTDVTSRDCVASIRRWAARDGGGRIVAEGTPEQVAATPGSHTGRFLAPVLARDGQAAPVVAPRRRRVGG